MEEGAKTDSNLSVIRHQTFKSVVKDPIWQNMQTLGGQEPVKYCEAAHQHWG